MKRFTKYEAYAFGEAVATAVDAHYGQLDKSGQPYIFHVMRVAMAVRTPHEKTVAMLHDVLEDSTYNEWYIRDKFGDNVANAVVALTRRKDESYEEYVARVAKASPAARNVKLADLTDNMDMGRIELVRKLTKADMERREKYKRARRTIERTFA